MLTSQLYLKHIPLQHREIPLRTEDQMVEHLNAYNVPSLPQGRATSLSSTQGSRLPLGWLWATKIAVASCLTASTNTSIIA